MIGTTDDPCSDLIWHEKLASDESFPVKVLPSFRPDPALNIHKPGFVQYIKTLSETTGRKLETVVDVADALSERIAFFAAHGCRAADHGLDYLVCSPVDEQTATVALRKALDGQPLTTEEIEGYQTALLLHCARAVSYTHLDVYKRQADASAAVQSAEKTAAG